MKHPELIENLGRIHKKVRGHDYGKFKCPFCPKTFIARISQVLNEHTTSCGCRKRKNFVEHTLRSIKSKTTAGQRCEFLADHRNGRTTRAQTCSKYKLRPREYSQFLLLAEQEYLNRPESTAPRASQGLKGPMAQAPQQTIINVGAGGQVIMKQHPADKLLVERPFNETEEGFWAQQAFYNEFKRLPESNEELVKWNQQRRSN